jgi:CRP-like cAMP-binding protein
MKWAQDDPIYWKGDIAESIYMIYKGSVRMMTENGVQFIIYKRGEIIGDSEALFESLRDSKAVAAETCVLYILKIEDCKEIFGQHPQAYIKMK